MMDFWGVLGAAGGPPAVVSAIVYLLLRKDILAIKDKLTSMDEREKACMERRVQVENTINERITSVEHTTHDRITKVATELAHLRGKVNGQMG